MSWGSKTSKPNDKLFSHVFIFFLKNKGMKTKHFLYELPLVGAGGGWGGRGKDWDKHITTADASLGVAWQLVFKMATMIPISSYSSLFVVPSHNAPELVWVTNEMGEKW